MNRPRLKRLAVVVSICALVGGLAGIAGSAAAPSKSSKSSRAQKNSAGPKWRGLRRGFMGPMMGGPGFAFGFGPVHAEAVVPKPDGSGFVTVTTDAGTLNSVDGTTVHLKEGTDKATYKDDVAVDVGSDAKVWRNGTAAKLSDLAQGDHVHVITGAPRGNVVIAFDDAWIAQMKKNHDRWGHHGMMGPGGPPPGMYPGANPPSTQNGSDQSPPVPGATSS